MKQNLSEFSASYNFDETSSCSFKKPFQKLCSFFRRSMCDHEDNVVDIFWGKAMWCASHERKIAQARIVKFFARRCFQLTSESQIRLLLISVSLNAWHIIEFQNILNNLTRHTPNLLHLRKIWAYKKSDKNFRKKCPKPWNVFFKLFQNFSK